MLYYNAGRILRETHARFYVPSSNDRTRAIIGLILIPSMGTFGTFDNGTEVSESIVEPTYVKNLSSVPRLSLII